MTEKNECGVRNAETAECLNFIFSAFRIPTSEFQGAGHKKQIVFDSE